MAKITCGRAQEKRAWRHASGSAGPKTAKSIADCPAHAHAGEVACDDALIMNESRPPLSFLSAGDRTRRLTRLIPSKWRPSSGDRSWIGYGAYLVVPTLSQGADDSAARRVVVCRTSFHPKASSRATTRGRGRSRVSRRLRGPSRRHSP